MIELMSAGGAKGFVDDILGDGSIVFTLPFDNNAETLGGQEVYNTVLDGQSLSSSDFRPGIQNDALYTGTALCGRCDSPAAIFGPRGYFSVSFWGYLEQDPFADCLFWGARELDSSTGGRFYLGLTPTREVTTRVDGGVNTERNVYIPGLHQWFNLVFTLSYRSAKIYINGSLEASFIVDDATFLTNRFAWGGVPSGVNETSGFGEIPYLRLDVLRVFNKTLSASEISILASEF